MRITAINVFQVDLPVKEGRYRWSNNNFVETFDSTIVELRTNEGLQGYAECCPLGSAYLPSFALGVRAGLDKRRFLKLKCNLSHKGRTAVTRLTRGAHRPPAVPLALGGQGEEGRSNGK